VAAPDGGRDPGSAPASGRGARARDAEDGIPEKRSTPCDAAAAGERILAAGWPDERSVRAALIDPVDPFEVTSLFEGVARTQPL